MKFECSTIINLPLEKTVALFNNEANLYHWQDGLQRIDHLEGVPGQVGARSRMFFKNKKYEFELIETILVSNLPYELKGLYQHEHMDNTMKCRFIELGNSRTKYEYEFEYTRMNWVMPRLIAILFPGMYRRQGEKWMKQFKEFVEKQ